MEVGTRLVEDRVDLLVEVGPAHVRREEDGDARQRARLCLCVHPVVPYSLCEHSLCESFAARLRQPSSMAEWVGERSHSSPH
ncbi:hypothetical protein ACFPRL_11515 [Pseudoclavibacter helvolus]